VEDVAVSPSFNYVRPLAGLTAALAALIPSDALACPVCAGRETNTTMIATMLGLMIVVPYVISIVVIRLVRKMSATELEATRS
jgi:hypothetical protein